MRVSKLQILALSLVFFIGVGVGASGFEPQIKSLKSELETSKRENQYLSAERAELLAKLNDTLEQLARSKSETEYLRESVKFLNSSLSQLYSEYEEAIYWSNFWRNQSETYQRALEEGPVTRSDIESWEAYFSPHQGYQIVNKIIYWIDRANKSIYVAIYSFTLKEIAEAVIRAKQRGVDVKVVMDKQQMSNKYSVDEFLSAAGVKVYAGITSGYMHNKYLVVDGYVVVTGSFNWSKHAAEENCENVIILLSRGLARAYFEDFRGLWLKASGEYIGG